MSDAFAQPRMLELGDAAICYRIAGRGEPLVLLHGFPLSGEAWRKLIPMLAPDFACYAFDVIGFGGSSASDPACFASQGQARVLQRALRTLGLSSYVLLGNDSGGWIARELALLEGARVKQLVLTNTEIPGHRPPWIPTYQRIAGLPGAAALFRRLLASPAWRRSTMGFGNCFRDRALVEGDFFQLFLAPLLRSRDRFAAALRFLRSMDFHRLDRFRTLHRELTMPVALIWGAADPTFPETSARAMAHEFAQPARFRSLPGLKLFLQEEDPGLLARELSTVLGHGPQA
jgi:pimeloyl-ACP methyl ester carboxylesterase